MGAREHPTARIGSSESDPNLTGTPAATVMSPSALSRYHGSAGELLAVIAQVASDRDGTRGLAR